MSTFSDVLQELTRAEPHTHPVRDALLLRALEALREAEVAFDSIGRRTIRRQAQVDGTTVWDLPALELRKSIATTVGDVLDCPESFKLTQPSHWPSG